MARFPQVFACVGGGPEVLAKIREPIERTGRTFVHVDSSELEARLSEIEVLLCGMPPRIDWSNAKKLRLLQLMGSGIETLFPAQGLSDEVVIANARGMHLPEMRDHALAMIFAFERELPRLFRQQEAKQWRTFASGTLAGKTIGIVGLGEVGRSIAKACDALGMRVIGTRANPIATAHVDVVFAPSQLDEVLRASEYVVVTVPLTRETQGLIGDKELAMLAPSAVLVHLSRGGVVDEKALERALRAGKLRGASLDVFEQEPLPSESPLWTTPNLLISPHLAGLVPDYVERATRVFLENLDRVERGILPRTLVDRARGY